MFAPHAAPIVSPAAKFDLHQNNPLKTSHITGINQASNQPMAANIGGKNDATTTATTAKTIIAIRVTLAVSASVALLLKSRL